MRRARQPLLGAGQRQIDFYSGVKRGIFCPPTFGFDLFEPKINDGLRRNTLVVRGCCYGRWDRGKSQNGS